MAERGRGIFRVQVQVGKPRTPENDVRMTPLGYCSRGGIAQAVASLTEKRQS